MNREEIEKEARKYAADKYGGENTRQWAIAQIHAGRDGFIAGAQWCINSAWHKPSPYGEELKRDVEVIAKTKRGYRFGKFDVVGYTNEYIGFVSTSSLEYALSEVLAYAYLNDLLPYEKGGMKACDIKLDLEEVCGKVRPSLAAKIRYSVDLIRKTEKLALRLDADNGFYNTFSYKGFIAGAEWRINSVWHTDLKDAQTQRKLLVAFTSGRVGMFDDIRLLKGIEDLVARYAYVDELLPSK